MRSTHYYVHLSVHLSHAGFFLEMAKCMMLFTIAQLRHSSFSILNYGGNVTWPPNGGIKFRGYEKIVTFCQYLVFISEMIQDRAVAPVPD